jgi:hypothetical protein
VKSSRIPGETRGRYRRSRKQGILLLEGVDCVAFGEPTAPEGVKAWRTTGEEAKVGKELSEVLDLLSRLHGPMVVRTALLLVLKEVKSTPVPKSLFPLY